jgi:hypothetical protein
VHRVAALVERYIVVVAERWEENLRVPYKALARREVGDLATIGCEQQVEQLGRQ